MNVRTAGIDEAAFKLPTETLRFLPKGALKEANHFSCSIRPLGVYMRAPRASAKPRVTASMHQPVFENDSAAQVTVYGTGERVTTWDLAVLGRGIDS